MFRYILDRVDKGDNHGADFTSVIAEWAKLGWTLVDVAADSSRAAAGSTAAITDGLAANLHTSSFIAVVSCIA